MKRLALLLLIWAAWPTCGAAGQASPLTVGSIRDQAGDPITGAQITGLGLGNQPAGTAISDADGTFALRAADIIAVRIACAFCEPVQIAVDEKQPIVAIIHRYVALLHDSPTPADVDALPYGHVESALSLTPFVVLADSTRVAPGPMLSDRGLSRAGGLFIDHDVPNYDLAANLSPFMTVPSRATNIVNATGAQEAYRYGDRADAGTFAIEPRSDAASLFASGGSEGIIQLHAASAGTLAELTSSDTAIDHRVRMDAEASHIIADGSIDASVSLGRGNLEPFTANAITQNFESARISAEVTRAERRYAEVLFDRGSYNIRFPGTIDANWADAQVRAGVESLGATHAFLEAGLRKSSGYYDAAPRIPVLAAALQQTQLTAGLRAQTPVAWLQAAVSVFDLNFSGGPLEDEYATSRLGAGTQVLTPSLNYRYTPDAHWKLDTVLASTFRLPTLLERYGNPPVPDLVLLDRNALVQSTLEYTDLARVRASLTAYNQRTTGLDNGHVSGVGLALAWQLAPRIATRAWVLRQTDTTIASMPLRRFTPAGVAATVGSFWMTYDAPGLRLDAIYRSDLLDTRAVSHFDYAMSLPMGSRARWFVGSEVRHLTRFFDAGIRLTQ